MNFLSKLF